MKSYEIFDTDLNRTIGVLLYYEKEHSFIVELMDDLDEWSAPLHFVNIINEGRFTASRELSLRWVQDRIIPSNRQNISSILSNSGLRGYDELALLERSKGICSQDSLCIRKLDVLPDFVINRMARNVVDCVPCEGFSLLVFFKDGLLRKVNLKDCLDFQVVDRVSKNEDLFRSCRVCAGGYCVSFNDSIDIPAAHLYSIGKKIPLSLNDFISFVSANVVDTTETCKLLDCSRQNLQYLIQTKCLKPLKKEVKGNLFLKGEVISSRR